MAPDTEACPMDVEISDPHNPKTDTEVDILLENGDIVVAVEVKSKPASGNHKKHPRGFYYCS